MQMRFLLGNLTSCVSMVLLFVACCSSKWAHDNVNSVDMGLWYFSGTGVQYKLINAGLTIEDGTTYNVAITSHRQYWYVEIMRSALIDDSDGGNIFNIMDHSAVSKVASTDPWCQTNAAVTRGLIIVALMAAISSFIVGMMVTFNIKTPTWDGEGKEATLVPAVVCSLVQVLCLLSAVIAWQQMVHYADAKCRTTMNVPDFTCISSGSAHILAIVDSPFAAVTYWFWRLSHSYYEAKKWCTIANEFTLAAKTDNVDEILSSIANKIDIDAIGSDGRNALHWACTLHRTSICHILLKKGASLSKKDRDGWTPIHWASRVGNLDIVRLLAKHGANLNIKDRWGTTPLMLTVVGENREAAETLIELGADVNARNVFGQTPLMLCIEAGTHLHQLGMVFLTAGADLSLQDAQGMTSLHYAACNGSVNLLLNMLQLCDAELVEKPNKYGETILQLAKLKQTKVLALLQDWQSGAPMVASHADVSSSEDDDDTEDTENDDSDEDDD